MADPPNVSLTLSNQPDNVVLVREALSAMADAVGVDGVEFVVRDNGTGIRPHIRADGEAALGIGLSIIQALAPRVEFRDVAGGGTEVRMEFAAPASTMLDALMQDGFEPPHVASSELA